MQTPSWRFLQKIHYNSTVILTFSMAAVAVHLANLLIPHFTYRYFAINPHMSFLNLLDYFRLVSYTLGHANWAHLFGNLSLILLLGPILEEKYGRRRLLMMMLVTAVSYGLLSVIVFHASGLGASGIVFMLILLSSIVNAKAGTIPLTFVFVAAIFIGQEIVAAFRPDNISQIGHILGGMCGAFFGFRQRH